ncbi:uncharacterized protein FIBRA_04404 [Fibroporia radiculosa]|uniref:Uncharacterized protein n=1 Tax=Fibroporia radiculosa TaxID=599839 RepID=J4G7B0_9APHY|nr:uncharacterized protein FIBRA_04404 [Fibroporia radiculosa]CCM02313.1 predicted protein [Fibroporia radiculosa]
MFSRRSNTPEDERQSPTNGARSTGFFGRRRSSSSEKDHGHARKDPSVIAARQKVTEAEAAEREADRALMQARAAVRGAREHVKNIEREASEDAKRAKAKQFEAKNISKSARSLGRHG